VTSVHFNGVAAPFRVVYSSFVSFSGAPQGPLVETVVPVGATTGAITLTTPAGTATSLANFTVLPSPAPTITGFTLTSGPAGTIVVVTGYGFFGTSSVTFNGVPATFTLPAPLDTSGFVTQAALL